MPVNADGRRRAVAGWSVLCTGAVAMIVYAFTVAPSLSWAHWGTDGGDFVTAAVSGRVPHPPGFPLYFWLSRLAVSVVSGDPAYVLNLLSALMASGAAALITATLLRRGVSSWGALPIGLAFAFAPWVWSQALITEVYTCAAFFASLTLLLTELDTDNDSWVDFLIGLSFGLTLSVHPTGLFLLPVIVVGRIRAWRRFVLGVVVGLLPYASLPLSGAWPQPWGDLRSLRGWAEMVTARMYWGNAFSLAATYWPRRALAWLVLVVRQFTPLGVPLAWAGLAQVWSDHRARVMGLVGSFALAGIYAIGYDSADSWVYLVSYLPVMALVVGAGLQWLADHGVPTWLGLFLPVVLLATNWQQMDLHAESTAGHWLEETLPALPSGAVVATASDQYTFALWYAVDAAGVRPDLTVVDRRLWGYRPYNEFLNRTRARLSDAQDGATIESWVGDLVFCEIDAEGGVMCR